jgi:adenosylhomocysteine nucleosidase
MSRGVLYAMASEVGPDFAGATPLDNVAGLDLRRRADGLLLCVCGIGKVNAALAAQLLIDRFGVDELWNAGVSGCFRDLPAGTLVVGSACVQHDFEIFGEPLGKLPVVDLVAMPCAGVEDSLARLTAAGLDCRPGVVASGDWFGRDYDRAARVRDQFDALVCDMEAGAAAQVCARCQVPFRSIKVVSDHLFHPSQYEEYQANVPGAVIRLSQALDVLLKD